MFVSVAAHAVPVGKTGSPPVLCYKFRLKSKKKKKFKATPSNTHHWAQGSSSPRIILHHIMYMSLLLLRFTAEKRRSECGAELPKKRGGNLDKITILRLAGRKRRKTVAKKRKM